VTFDKAHYLLRLVGHFGTDEVNHLDEWSTGLRLAGTTDVPIATAPLIPFLETISGAIATFHAMGSSLVGPNCYLDMLTIARIGLEGHYDPPFVSTIQRLYSTPPAGGGAPTQPWSTALVTSLRTTKPRGYASNGRMYYPALAAIPDVGTGRETNNHVATYLTNVKAMFDAINAAAPVIRSDVRISVMSAVGSGLSLPATSIRADGRLDTQERRENKAPSVYSTKTLA
jgi:hypothetical protein